MSAWHSVVILAAVQTWAVLWDVLSSLTKKPSCSPKANLLPWYSETWLCSSLAKGHCHGSCCPLWLLHATAAASVQECPGKDQGRREGRRCVVPAGALHRAAGVFYRRRWAEGTAGEQQICSYTPPEQIREGFSCTQPGESLNSHSDLHSGEREKEWKVDAPVFAGVSSFFLNLSWWMWLDVFLNT